MHSKSVAACCFLVALVGLSACGDEPSSEPAAPARSGTAAGVSWVSLPAEAGPAFDLDEKSFYVPEAAAVDRALEGVGAYVTGQAANDDRAPGVAKRLSEYQCQVIGVIEKGRKRLYLSFVHGNVIVGMRQDGQGDWRAEPVVVLDGGDLFWNVRYDPAADTFAGLMINGES